MEFICNILKIKTSKKFNKVQYYMYYTTPDKVQCNVKKSELKTKGQSIRQIKVGNYYVLYTNIKPISTFFK